MEKRHYPAAVAATALMAVLTLYLNSLVAVRAARPAARIASHFSAQRYLEHVRYLASDEMRGRGDGSPELDKAAEYIASQFRLWGLRPMGDNNTYFQNFELTTGADVGPKTELRLNGMILK